MVIHYTQVQDRRGGCGTFMKKLKLGMQSSECKIPLPSGQAVSERGWITSGEHARAPEMVLTTATWKWCVSGILLGAGLYYSDVE
jgi:hypothetical protein